MCQIGTSSSYGGRRKLPYVFTENGITMLSSILNSPHAIKVNISIMRTFTSLRKILKADESLVRKIENLENGTLELNRGVNKIFKIIFERLDSSEEEINNLKRELPSLSPKRKRIGIKS